MLAKLSATGSCFMLALKLSFTTAVSLKLVLSKASISLLTLVTNFIPFTNQQGPKAPGLSCAMGCPFCPWPIKYLVLSIFNTPIFPLPIWVSIKS